MMDPVLAPQDPVRITLETQKEQAQQSTCNRVDLEMEAHNGTRDLALEWVEWDLKDQGIS